jgi:hypothetical protein
MNFRKNLTESLITLSLNNQIINPQMPNVSLCSETVVQAQSLKYLGVVFDLSRFAEHVDNVVTKARKGLVAMKILAATICKQ